MATSLAEFKQAFSGKKDDGAVLASRTKEVADALKSLGTAIKKNSGRNVSDGPDKVLRALFKRYQSAADQAALGRQGAVAEFDDILRQTRMVTAKLEEGPAGGGPLADAGAAPPPPTGAPAPQASRPKASKRKMRTGVILVPNVETVRAGLEKWVAGKISRSRAPFIVNLSNYRDMHTDGNVLELHGAEILAEVTTAPGRDVSVEFSWDPKFTAPNPDKYWMPEDGKLPIIFEIIDGKTGVPIKGAKVRFNDGRSAVTDAKGKAKVEAPIDSEWNVEVSAPGYQKGQKKIMVGLRGTGGEEYPMRLMPLDPKTVDKVNMGITVVDLTTSAKIEKAKMTISKAEKQPFLTDSDGFTTAYLFPGVYAYKLEAKGYVTEAGNLEIPESKEQEFKTIGMKPAGAEDVFVRVLDSKTDDPLPRVSVRLGTQLEMTDSHGEVRFGGVPFGEHRLWASIDGYGVYDKTVVHSAATATHFKEVKLKAKTQ